MNLTLWIVASILSLLFLASGTSKLARSRQALVEGGYAWAQDFSDQAVRYIAALEILGALGLVLPGVFGVATFLVPAAGAGLAVLMLAAVGIHVRRGETTQASAPILLAAVAAAIAIMRVVTPL